LYEKKVQADSLQAQLQALQGQCNSFSRGSMSEDQSDANLKCFSRKLRTRWLKRKTSSDKLSPAAPKVKLKRFKGQGFEPARNDAQNEIARIDHEDRLAGENDPIAP